MFKPNEDFVDDTRNGSRILWHNVAYTRIFVLILTFHGIKDVYFLSDLLELNQKLSQMSTFLDLIETF